MRCFIALPLPPEAREALDRFADRGRSAWPRLRWTSPESFHLTLAFLGEIEGPALGCARDCLVAAAGEAPIRLAFSGLEGFPSSRPAAAPAWRVLVVRTAAIERGVEDQGAASVPGPRSGSGSPSDPGTGSGPAAPGKSREAPCARIHRLVNERLARLAAEAGLGRLNEDWPGGRPFAPHVTIARVPGPRSGAGPRRGSEARGGSRPGAPPRIEEIAAALDPLPPGAWEVDRCVLYRSELGPAGSVYTEIGAVALRGRG